MRNKKPTDKTRREFKVVTGYRDHVADVWYPNYKYTVLQRGYTLAVNDSDYGNPEYFTTVTFDGDSNVVLEYHHAQGRGKVVIPHGGIYSIVTALQILHKLGLNTQIDEQITSMEEIK